MSFNKMSTQCCRHMLGVSAVILVASVCFGVDCIDFPELEVAAHDTKASEINLTGSTYIMTEILYIEHDCTISNVSGDDTTIDGLGIYLVRIDDADVTVTGSIAILESEIEEVFDNVN